MKNAASIDFIREVTPAAAGKWPFILAGLNIDVPDSPRRHAACPACGGKDRFRFDDNGRGAHFCNACGAGDGLELVKKVNNCDITTAARLVAGVLGMDERVVTPDSASQKRNSPVGEPRRQQTADEVEQRRATFTAKYQALAEKTTLGESGYLAAKGLDGFAFPVLPDNSLLLALVDESGAVVAAQTITTQGEKRLLAGSAKKGAYHAINTTDTPQAVIIGEGLATVLSAHRMRPDALAVVAVDAGNLLPVAQVMRRKYPQARIVIAADNDLHDDNQPNTGREAAEKAAIAVAGWVALPPTGHKADWNDYYQQYGLETATRAFTAGMYQPKEERVKPELTVTDGGKDHVVAPALNQMGPSQRGDVLAAHYDNDLAIDGDSDTVHHYNGMVWKPVQDKDLQRVMARIFIDADIAYSPASVRNAVDAMKLSLPQMGAPARHLIGFRNGVFDTRAAQFREHDKDDWLLIASDVDFCQPENGESLEAHAPNFWHWLQHATAKDSQKADRLLAALFMVLANRYDWQLFLEVTGPGGSGKSVMSEICTMLAGKGNTVSAPMAALENPRERALVVGASLIIMPDMARYAGDGAGIKAITGGDRVSIDPKHKAPYSVRIRAVVLAVNNNAMTFSDRSGGISRRRVIFNFPEVVNEKDRDPMLVEKIEAELPVIIRHLLTRFASQDDARHLLAEQRKSEEALAIKREGDSLVDFCGYLMALVECEGMIVGNAEMVPFSPRRYLYHSYLAYMSAHGLGKPVSLTRFGSDMPGSMAEYGCEYRRKQCTRGPDKGRTVSNVLLKDEAETWLPAATGNNTEDKVKN
ncbi:toprim domain-containing protein [Salmonella enterica subsp. enterica]|nr:toprim domain-containing protein [Salmonella enterica subsp. enterica]